jgi:hypothetical protein
MNIPICNIETEEIAGCKNQKEYNHEKNHIDFSKTNKGMLMQYFAQLSEFYTIICITLTFFIPLFKWFSAIGVVLMLFFFIYEEIWCNEQRY